MPHLSALPVQLFKPQLWFLIVLVSFGTVSAVLFTPALPEIATFFQVDTNTAQLTMSLFLIGYALGQLPYGPIANRFGRVKAIKSGVILQIIGGLLCVLSYHLETFQVLLVGRFVMALGASVGLTLCFTLINDFYEPTKARQMSSKLVCAFAILPGMALSIGGCLTDWFAWQNCFYFLIMYGAFIYVVTHHYLQEPKDLKRQAIGLKSLQLGFGKMLSQKNVVGYAGLWGLSTAIIYIFNSMSPFLAIEKLNLSESSFGFLSTIVPLGILLGSWITHRLNARYDALRVILGGVVGAMILSAFMWVGFIQDMTLIKLFGFMFLINVCLTLVVANASILASSGASDKATASSIVSFLNMGIGGLGVFIAQFLPQNWLGSLPFMFVIITVAMMGIFLLLYKASLAKAALEPS